MKPIYIFRGVALILLIILASKPVIVRPDPGVSPNWAVLLDASASMRVKDPAARLDAAKEAAAALLKRMDRPGLFQFADTASALAVDQLNALQPTGKLSDLALGIRQALSGKKYRGAVVFTDGREVGKEDAVSTAATIGAPLLLVGVGDRALFKDVSVRAVNGPPFAFKNVATSLSATISVIGYPGAEVSVSLKEGGRTISIQKVKVAGAEAEATVAFTWTPSSVGSKVLTVETDRYAGEVTTVNNRKEIALDVGRDKFRVLYICGVPGPEYGFLRHQFKADPAVELVTFVILRNAQNTVNIPEGELSLIPFPTQDVLINQMSTFDLVVFEEFSYHSYGLSPAVVYAIRQKVQEGGSFLIMGGQAAFGLGSGYAIPGIREMIPVEFGAIDVPILTEPVPFIAKAPAHPVLRLDENAERNREIWRNLPPIDDVAVLPGVKPGATVLGSIAYQGKEAPVLTVWKFGKGRVGAMTARTTWRWSMQGGGAGVPADAYQRFWKNMVLWLTHSDDFKPVRVAMENKVAHVDEKQTLRVWVYDDYFKPLSDVDVRLQITAPDGTTADATPYAETSGVFAATFKPAALGEYKIQAWVQRNGKRFGADATNARVVENLSEEEDLRPNFDLLRELARATGGKFIPLSEFSPAVFTEFNESLATGGNKKTLLWTSPWFMVVLLLLFIVEWIWRKRRGLP